MLCCRQRKQEHQQDTRYVPYYSQKVPAIFQTCGKSYEEIMGLEDQDLYLLFQEPDRGGYFHRIVRYQHEFGKRNLLGRFGRMFCHSDIINYGHLHDIDFQRTQTLCQGGQKCDFCFVRHRKGEVWKRSESI